MRCNAVTNAFETLTPTRPDPTRPDPNYLKTRVETPKTKLTQGTREPIGIGQNGP